MENNPNRRRHYDDQWDQSQRRDRDYQNQDYTNRNRQDDDQHHYVPNFVGGYMPNAGNQYLDQYDNDYDNHRSQNRDWQNANRDWQNRDRQNPNRDWNQNRDWRNANYGSGQRHNEWNQPYSNMNDYNRNRNFQDEGRYSDHFRYQGQNYGAGYGSNYGREQGPRNMYGGDTRNYGNANQGGYDRDWWEKTKDEVASWFGDDDAERRRRMDKTSGPYRGKGPKGYNRSDERIKEDVCDRLADNPLIDASEIDITVKDREVILTGTVESRDDKRRAEDIAESVSGVSNVQNQLKVDHSKVSSPGLVNRRREE